MQPNPFLTVLKIAAFAVLAFLVGVSSCQKANLEDKIEALTSEQARLSTSVDELARVVRSGALPTQGTGPVNTTPAVDYDAHPDPAKPVGTPGRYRNFVSEDPDPEIPAEAKGKTEGQIGAWFGPDPKGFNFYTENDGQLSEAIEGYCADSPAGRHWRNPSLWSPAVCWRVEVSPDYREYTLFFRKDVVWHPPAVDLAKYPHLAGRHLVTAKDYKFTIDMVLNPQTDCAAQRNYYSDIESVAAVDDWTAVVKWKETLWHSVASTLGATIMPEFLFAYGEDGKRFPPETIGNDFNNHFYNKLGVCGCGPYRFKEYSIGQQMVLERFEDWYGAREGKRYPIRTIRQWIFNDSETNLNKIKAGEITIGGLSAPQWKKEVLENRDEKSPFVDGRIAHWVGKRARYLYFGWKNTNPLFKDKRVRKALALACNREQICHEIFLDRYRPMASPVYPESAEADPQLTPLPFDLKAAASVLDEAGWKVNPATGLREKDVEGRKRAFEFALLWPGPAPDFESALNQYKNDLLTIGVKMDPQTMQWAVFQKRLEDREFEAVSLLWATNGWEHDFDQIWHSRGIQDPGSSNHIEFSNPEVDRLSDALRREMDLGKRIEMVRRIGRVLYEEQPYCFFGWQNALGVNWSYLQNVLGHEYKMRPFLRYLSMWDAR